MKWTSLFNADENILSIKTYGIFDLITKMELMKECVVAFEKQSCRQCLIDNSEIESKKISFMEIYSIPEKFVELNMSRNLRIAEVFLEKYIKDFDILETVSFNRGYRVSVFSDVESAMQWLKK